jgi:hypothetical protein
MSGEGESKRKNVELWSIKNLIAIQIQPTFSGWYPYENPGDFSSLCSSK